MDGLKLVPCDGYAQIERLMEQGTKIRTTASTSMNATSSRSHMVITIQFKQVQYPDSKERIPSECIECVGEVLRFPMCYRPSEQGPIFVMMIRL